MGAILPVLSIGLSAVTGIAQMGAASAQAAATREAANRQITAQYSEIQRQETQVNQTASEQASDRMRAADAEMGTVRTMALERGVSGTTMSRFASTVGYLEGLDLSRINTNRQSNIAQGEAAKVAAQNDYISTVTIADNQAKVATTGAILNTLGSGLQIYGGYQEKQSTLNYLKNLRA